MQHSWCKSQNTQVVGSAKKNINYILNSDFFLNFFFFFFLDRKLKSLTEVNGLFQNTGGSSKCEAIL